MSHPTDEQMREAARSQYESEGSIEIDEDAPVSRSEANEDGGAYVQAWVWVSDDDAEDE